MVRFYFKEVARKYEGKVTICMTHVNGDLFKDRSVDEEKLTLLGIKLMDDGPRSIFADIQGQGLV